MCDTLDYSKGSFTGRENAKYLLWRNNNTVNIHLEQPCLKHIVSHCQVKFQMCRYYRSCAQFRVLEIIYEVNEFCSSCGTEAARAIPGVQRQIDWLPEYRSV